MSLSQAQLDTVNGLDEKGFHLDEGTPCECGPEAYSTTSNVGYSDFVKYTHTCGECGNEFTTYIEG